MRIWYSQSPAASLCQFCMCRSKTSCRNPFSHETWSILMVTLQNSICMYIDLYVYFQCLQIIEVQITTVVRYYIRSRYDVFLQLPNSKINTFYPRHITRRKEYFKCIYSVCCIGKVWAAPGSRWSEDSQDMFRWNYSLQRGRQDQVRALWCHRTGT